MPKSNKIVETKLKKAKTVSQIQSQTVVRIPFEGDWYQSLGNPQNRGIWFVWGQSASGKSTYQMMLAKELAKHYKTAYNLLEEEDDDSDYIDRTELLNMHEVEKNFHTISYNYEELDKYLSSQRSAKVVIIDSLPYFLNDWQKYLDLKKKYAKKKILVFVGHAKGKDPRTDFQERVMYDAKMKIFVSGYLATCKGRTIGPNGGTFIIWEEGYNKVNGLTVQPKQEETNPTPKDLTILTPDSYN